MSKQLQINFINETIIARDSKLGSTSQDEVHIFMLQSVSLSQRYVHSGFERIRVKFDVEPGDLVWVVSMTYADRSNILWVFHKDDLCLAKQLQNDIMDQDPRSFDEMYANTKNEGIVNFCETSFDASLDAFKQLKDPRASDELYGCRGYNHVEVRIDPILVGV